MIATQLLAIAFLILVLGVVAVWASQRNASSKAIDKIRDAVSNREFVDMAPADYTRIMTPQRRPMSELESAWRAYSLRWVRWNGHIVFVAENRITISIYEHSGVHLKALVKTRTIDPEALTRLKVGHLVHFEVQLPADAPWKSGCGLDEYLPRAEIIAAPPLPAPRPAPDRSPTASGTTPVAAVCEVYDRRPLEAV